MDNNGHRDANIFTASFNASAITTNGCDVFGFMASTSGISRAEILAINLGVVSSGVSVAQNLAVQLLRGSTAASTSAVITPTNLRGWTGVPTDSGSSITGPSSGLVSTASAVMIWSDSFSIGNGWLFPTYQELTGLSRPVIASGQRLHCRITAPSTAISLSGTLCYRLLGGGNAA